MSQVIQRGRHRAAGRPVTALDDLRSSISSSVPTALGRTAVVAVASSSLVLGSAAASQAAPPEEKIEAPSLKATSLSAAEVARAGTQSTVSVSAETPVAFTAATVSAEAPPPPPPPPPPVVRTVSSSRSRTVAAPVSNQSNSSASSSSSSSESAPAPAINGGLASAIIAEAYKHVGTRYVTGGSSPSAGFDCSGFTQYVYGKFGISLPRTSGAQRNAGYVVSASEARAGDLIWAPGHVGIYLGNGQHIAARNPSTPLKAGPIYMKNPTYIRVLG